MYKDDLGRGLWAAPPLLTEKVVPSLRFDSTTGWGA